MPAVECQAASPGVVRPPARTRGFLRISLFFQPVENTFEGEGRAALCSTGFERQLKKKSGFDEIFVSDALWDRIGPHGATKWAREDARQPAPGGSPAVASS